MGMQSEIAIEHTILIIVAEIKKDLEQNNDKLDVSRALKKLGRFALTQLEGSPQSCSAEYQELFKES
jgi:hypothetical protein